MARTNDFAFVFRGGADGKLLPFKLGEKLSGALIDTTAYEKAKQAKGGARTLTTMSTGAGAEGDDDLNSHLMKLIGLIQDKCGFQLGTIGSCCIVGSSNGCALALALGAWLTKVKAPKLNFIGLVDVPLMPAGRNPAVPHVGNLRPQNPPSTIKLTTAQKIGAGGILPVYPKMDQSQPPVAKLDSSIDAAVALNHFEVQGNHMTMWKRSPRGQFLDWWWNSSMFAGEVHGEIEGIPGLQNKPLKVSGNTDFELHDALCQGDGFTSLLSRAGVELAKLPD